VVFPGSCPWQLASCGFQCVRRYLFSQSEPSEWPEMCFIWLQKSIIEPYYGVNVISITPDTQSWRNVGVNTCMNIVYNSENYYVVEYPQEHGYEVVDKQAGRGTYFQGNVAEKFRVSMLGALGEDPSSENVDEFLYDFGGLISFTTTIQ
jgi:hypothetical protein